MAAHDYYSSVEHPLWGNRAESYGPAQSQKAELGGYTFRITGAAFLDYQSDSPYRDQIQLTLRVSSPRFWERIDPDALCRHLTVVDPDGKRWPMNRWDVNTGPDQTIWQITTGAKQSRWGLFYREFAAYLDAPDWSEGDRVTLDFDFGQGGFSLMTNEIERVVME